MKKLESLNTRKLEDYKTQTVNTPWKIRGGQKRKTTINHKDKDGNIVAGADNDTSGYSSLYWTITI